MDNLTQILCPTGADLIALQQFVNNQESPLCRFNNISESGLSPSPNVLTLSILDSPVQLAPVQFQQIDPNMTADQAGVFLDNLIDQGLQPDSDDFFDINVPGGEVSIVVFRGQATFAPVPDGQGLIQTLATVFGLNMDGSIDSEDNGVGSPILGSVNTRDPHLVGAAVPIAIAKAQFGSLQNVRGNRVQVTSNVTNITITAPIVDFGPSVAQVARGMALDLTLAAQRAIGGNGKTPVRYRFV
jgi:hypothetical protein